MEPLLQEAAASLKYNTILQLPFSVAACNPCTCVHIIVCIHHLFAPPYC
jgi:hypothetical protein